MEQLDGLIYDSSLYKFLKYQDYSFLYGYLDILPEMISIKIILRYFYFYQY